MEPTQVDLWLAMGRVRQRVARVQEHPGLELVEAGRAALVFNGMDVDGALLNAIVDATVLARTTEVMHRLVGTTDDGLEREMLLLAALRGAFVEGALFGYEIRSDQS